MNKLRLFRRALLEAPLRIRPDKLLTYADKGKVISYPGDANSRFETHYTAVVILTDYAGPTDVVCYLATQWMRTNQPDHQPDAIQFQADILNHDAADLEIRLDLSETLVPVQLPNGDIQLHHCPDPLIDPVLLPASEWRVYLDDQPIISWSLG